MVVGPVNEVPIASLLITGTFYKQYLISLEDGDGFVGAGCMDNL